MSTQTPFKEPQFLGLIGYRPRGNYDSDTAYRKMDTVYHAGCTWAAKIDNPDLVPSLEGHAVEQWQLVALGYPDSENLVRGVKGDAELDYRVGFVNLTKADIGLDRVGNHSLEDIQENTVKSLSWNGLNQRFQHDVDLGDVVHHIFVNDKPEPLTNEPHLHIVTGLSLNGSELLTGALIFDVVNTVQVNQKEPVRGNISLEVVEGIRLNGDILPLSEDGTVNIEVSEHPIWEIRKNNEPLEIDDHVVSFDCVDTVRLNNTAYVPENGSIDLFAVEHIRLDGEELVLQEDGTVDIVLPEIEVPIQEIIVNGEKAEPQGGAVTLSVLEGIKYQDELVPIENGIAHLNIDFPETEVPIQTIIFNGNILRPSSYTIDFSALTDIKINGETVPVKDGVAEITYEVKAPEDEKYVFAADLWNATENYYTYEIVDSRITENNEIEIIEPIGNSFEDHVELSSLNLWCISQENGKAVIAAVVKPSRDLNVILRFQ